jgi:hypothetical protein
MQKFTKQLPKDDLKKFAKEVGKKLVASDFKNGRVEDPTKISEKQEKKVKAYVRQFFEKAVEKKKELDKRKKEKERAKLANGSDKLNGKDASPEELDDVKVEDIDLTPSSPSPPGAPSSPHASVATPSFTESSPELKRKRTGEETPGDESDGKRLKEEHSTPPPPPPPPPAEGMPLEELQELPDAEMDEKEIMETEEEKELRRQEEDLMRENEEAMKMEQAGSLNTKSFEENGARHINMNGNGNGVEIGEDSMEGLEDSKASGMERERESLMSH